MPGQLYNLTSSYGNEQQLIELNKQLKAAGIVPMADIVINHRYAAWETGTSVVRQLTDSHSMSKLTVW